MRTIFGLLLNVWLILLGFAPALAQPAAADTLAPGQNEHPEKPQLIVETDQRFFFFKERPTGPRYQTNVWGARAGLLFPSNIKAGVGYYFTSHPLREPYFYGGYEVKTRQLTYATFYVEPFYFRRRFWEFSTPIEVGVGAARYTLLHLESQEMETRRSWAVPLGAGLSFSVKMPPIKGWRPLRWFGLNFMAGYRVTIQNRIPYNPVTFNGFFYSVSPVILLDRFYEDYTQWRRGRRSEKTAQK